MTLDATLLFFRMMCHLITALVIGFYVGNPDKHRWFIGVLAFLMAGASAAEAARIATDWRAMLSIEVIQPWLTIIVAVLCGLVIIARGNVADIFNRSAAREAVAILDRNFRRMFKS